MTDLPEDLRGLEDRIARLSAEGPSTDFRRRLIGAVNVEIGRTATPRSTGVSPVPSDARATNYPRPALESWYWITAAASILIVLNVSLISASRTEFSFGRTAGPAPLTAELHALRAVENQMNGKYK